MGMTTLHQCDWCGDVFDDRAQVASIDLTIGTANEKMHACVSCVPDWVKQHFPDERTPTST